LWKLFCLVRATHEAEGLQRLRKIMEFYGIVEQLDFNRIKIVCGNLEEKMFGISPQSFETLAEDIRLIFHAGCVVNWVKPYSEQRKANVFGTREILKLATTKYLKAVVHISTMSVEAKITANSYALDSLENFKSTQPLRNQDGYIMSKWLAEHFVRKAAMEHGVPTCIIRPGMITGHSRTGSINEQQFVGRYLSTVVRTKKAIDEEIIFSDMNPVDYVAKMTADIAVKLMEHHDQLENWIFHLAGHNWVNFQMVANAFSNLEIQIEKMQAPLWREELLKAATNDSAIAAILSLIPKDIRSWRTQTISSHVMHEQEYEKESAMREILDVSPQHLIQTMIQFLLKL